MRSPATTPEALRAPCPLKAPMKDADEFWALIALLGDGYSRPGANYQFRATLAELQPEKLVGFTDQRPPQRTPPTGRASAQRAPGAHPTRPAE